MNQCNKLSINLFVVSVLMAFLAIPGWGYFLATAVLTYLYNKQDSDTNH